MSADSTLEFVTHIAVLVFYLAALGMGVYAHYRTRLWARKVSTIAIVASAVGWVLFYSVFTNPLTVAGSIPDTVLWSRAFHYVSASGLFLMAFIIARADRYGLHVGDD